MDEMQRLDTIFDAVVGGQQKVAVAEVTAALAEGVAAGEILHGACIPAMDEVGCQFEEGERFVPEMLLSARTMAAVVDVLRPHLVTAGEASLGAFVIGTVAGDVHDIGKNLVGMMMEGAGFQVIDLGTDVPAQKGVAAVQEHRPVLLGLSALLTTTMPAVGATIGALRAAGSSLDQALARFRDAHLPAERSWPPREFIAELDRLAPGGGLLPRLEHYLADTGFPDLDPILSLLGRDTVAVEPGKTPSALSRSIMQPQGPAHSPTG